ncbi:RNA methyltransferase [Desulfurococcus mucosus]|uniref:tRNA/rRNA methyltransferase (SpoU) n=1 Tax=Desulfurococcus mucosus (strain ATCC 35584 / DSM 2162 / JCM 9187 / O7/1) TaxID=765177 RepID=E8RAD7_DESM0|nr:RNA methyltransferase [Desulfurococcus mucosus]ADV64347.1 tRNA/rRNA methyltransferase (SpoU) [Desulfurococcus mucosus DSM 2162]
MIRVVLVGIEGAVNLGVIARTCVNFGVDELYIVKPVASLDEALNYAAKGRGFLENAVVTDSLDEAIKGVDMIVATSDEGYSESDMLRQAVDLSDFAERIFPRTRSVAILFGRESTGLTREEIGRADILVTIPANPAYPVLNVSQAVAVVLWELWKHRGMEAVNVPRKASRDLLGELLSLAVDVSRSVMSTEEKVARSRILWKRMLSKAMLTEKEARVLKYWLQRVRRQLRQDCLHE